MKPTGVLLAAALLCALIVYAGPAASEALAPMLGIAVDGSQMATLETLFVVVIFGSLLGTGLIGGWVSGVNPLRPGSRAAMCTLAGFAVGGGGVAAAAAYAWLANSLSFADAQHPALLWGSAVILLQSLSEEVFFRGWLQPVLSRYWGAVAAVSISAAAFAGLHILGGARSPTTLVNLFLGGFLFGAIAYYRQGIAGAVAAHFAWNWTEQMVLGLTPNPGVGSFGAIYDLDLAGAALWGGSDEGLNASIGMTMTLSALLIAILLLIRSRRAVPTRSASSG